MASISRALGWTWTVVCAACGIAGGVTLKACMSCMLVKYGNADCQRNHWPTRKKNIARNVLRRDIYVMRRCSGTRRPWKTVPFASYPMPIKLLCCISLPPRDYIVRTYLWFRYCTCAVATFLSTETYYDCCGKSICGGCLHSAAQSGNMGKCPFFNAVTACKRDKERHEALMKGVEANDACAIHVLGNHYHYHHGDCGLQQNHAKAIELWMDSGCGA